MADLVEEAVEGAAKKFLTSFHGNANQSTLRDSIPGGELVAVRIAAPALDDDTGSARVVASVDDVEVSLPSTLVTSLFPARAGDNGASDTVVLVVAALNSAAAEGFGGTDGSSAPGPSTISGQVTTRCLAAVSVDLVSALRGMLAVSGLLEPIALVLPVNFTPGLKCAYWEDGAASWSTAGVETTHDAENRVKCLTTHLSLFGAIVQGFVTTAECSQVSLLNTAAMALVFQGNWATTPGALALWAVLVLLLVMQVAAACIDSQNSWGNAFFLAENRNVHSAHTEEEEKADKDNEDEQGPQAPSQDGILETIICCTLGFFSTCWRWAKDSSSLRDAFDEIMSTWFEYFSDLRSLCEELFASLETDRVGGDESQSHAHVVNMRITSHLLLGALRRVVGASLGVSDALVCFVLQDKSLFKFLTEEHCDRLRGAWDADGGRPRSSMTALADMATAEMAAKSQKACGSSSHALQPCGTTSRGIALQDRVPAREDSRQVTLPLPSFLQAESFRQGPGKVFAQLPSVGVLNRGVKWKSTRNKREAWAILHHEVGQRMQKMSELYSERWGLLRMILRIFVVQSPLTSTFFFNPLISSKMRALFVSLDVLGTLTLSALFFQTSGSVKGKSAFAGAVQCGGDSELSDTIGFQTGRLLAIATGSVLIAGIPVAILTSLHTRSFRLVDHEGSRSWKRQLRIWQIEDKVIWVVGSCYCAACAFFNFIFLASSDAEDHLEYTKSLLIALTQIFIIIPLVVSAVIPTLAWFALHGNHRAGWLDRADTLRRAQEKVHKNSNIMLPIVYV